MFQKNTMAIIGQLQGFFIMIQKFKKEDLPQILELCQERDTKEIRLGVYNQNEIAYKFYEHYGFKALEQKMVLNLD